MHPTRPGHAGTRTFGFELGQDRPCPPLLQYSYGICPGLLLRANGLGQIGSLKHLPPTLLAQYHFTNFGAFKPYVGAGINYTRFSSVNFNPAVQAALNPSIKKNSFGGALQIGFDYALDKNWSVNFDVKKVFIETDVSAAGTKVGTFKVNPVLVGVGLGYRF
jgi:outer membrane protein